MKKIIVTCGAALALTACSSVQTDRPFQELGRAAHLHLKYDGFIIGIEKRNITKKGVLLAGLDTIHPYRKRFSDTGADKKFKKVTNRQQKVMIATQITSNVSSPYYIYNAYAKDLDGEYNYETSFSKTDEMFKNLKKAITSTKYTHIIVMSMGWNTGQVESIKNFNVILGNIESSIDTKNEVFKPLVIGLTWPSVWMSNSDSKIQKKAGHIFSYPNKANDADEIGYTWANWILNKKLPEATAGIVDKPKIVAIGHSFGARLLSRAIFSSEYIHSEFDRSSSVDLFIGLQGAFSLNRFIDNKGNEDSAYSDYKDLKTKIALTTSKNDIYNSAAFFVTGAKHAGGRSGLREANKSDNSDIFDVQIWDPISKQVSLPKGKVLILDAAEIIKDENGLAAHNDILDKEMGSLIWNLMKNIE